MGMTATGKSVDVQLIDIMRFTTRTASWLSIGESSTRWR